MAEQLLAPADQASREASRRDTDEGTGKVERETGFEPATFCLGSPGVVSVVA
jgi:hypothetical protein